MSVERKIVVRAMVKIWEEPKARRRYLWVWCESKGNSRNVAMVKKVVPSSLKWGQRAIDIERKFLGHSRRKLQRVLAIGRVEGRVLGETSEGKGKIKAIARLEHRERGEEGGKPEKARRPRKAIACVIRLSPTCKPRGNHQKREGHSLWDRWVSQRGKERLDHSPYMCHVRERERLLRGKCIKW